MDRLDPFVQHDQRDHALENQYIKRIEELEVQHNQRIEELEVQHNQRVKELEVHHNQRVEAFEVKIQELESYIQEMEGKVAPPPDESGYVVVP